MTACLGDIQSLCNQFAPANEELFQQRALLQRIDRKYILHQSRLPALLDSLREHYAIAPAPNDNIAHYQNQYFDTTEYLFLREHHRGRRPRYKIRIRHYGDRQISMLECKRKSATNLTIKSRVRIPFSSTALSDHNDFISEHSPIPCEDLHPGINNQFQRISLLGLAHDERVTLDIDVQLQLGERCHHLSECVIVETKRHPLVRHSFLNTKLRNVRAYPLSISKYCTAGFFLLPEVPMKLYRPKMRLLRKILHDRAI